MGTSSIGKNNSVVMQMRMTTSVSWDDPVPLRKPEVRDQAGRKLKWAVGQGIYAGLESLYAI